mmetsp:Transcript_1928/g.4167  ORF Transcript_1928/g.4167 Transcript_1928/m.4167 type:complete len:215 (+) Transcript_1928:354-998(+)
MSSLSFSISRSTPSLSAAIVALSEDIWAAFPLRSSISVRRFSPADFTLSISSSVAFNSVCAEVYSFLTSSTTFCSGDRSVSSRSSRSFAFSTSSFVWSVSARMSSHSLSTTASSPCISVCSVRSFCQSRWSSSCFPFCSAMLNFSLINSSVSIRCFSSSVGDVLDALHDVLANESLRDDQSNRSIANYQSLSVPDNESCLLLLKTRPLAISIRY